MRITRRVLINTVGFLVLAVFLFFLMAVRLLPTVFGETYSIYGIFETAGGVFTNQEVTYRGVQVGRVGEMSLTEDAVRMEMVIESKYQIPKGETRARVLYKSAVGEQFIDILPVSGSGPFFRQGDVIPLEMTSVPIQTEDLLRDLDAVLESIDPEALGTVIRELGEGLRGHGGDLRQLLLALDTLAALGVDRQADIALGISAGADVQEAFNASREDFVAASGSLAKIAEVLARRRADLERTLDAAQPLDAAMLSLLRARRAQIETVIADLAAATRITHDQLDDLDLILTYLGPFLSNVYDAYAAPYFMFNLVANPEGAHCSYDPSSRTGGPRPITDTSFKQPVTNFGCPGENSTTSVGSLYDL